MLQPPFHPAFVHFPIALYLLGVLFSLAYLWRKKPEFDQFAFWAFFLSWIAAVTASIVGLIDKGQLAYNDPRQEAINRHVTFSVAFIILSGLVSYERFKHPNILQTSRKWLYLSLILAGTIVIFITGWLGGELVYNLQIGLR